jgi:PAS domain S-box-containing protein
VARGESVDIPKSTKITELQSLEEALRAAVRGQDALKRAEEQNRSVVDHVIDAIITIDERGTIESSNRAAEKLFGFAAPEIIGQNVKILMPEPYRTEHDRYIADYVATGRAKIIGIGREVVGRRKDGSTFPMELAVSEFGIGAQRFFTGIVRDITERKRAEQALKEADRQKDEFLAMVSHELRNPLSALTTAARVLRAATANDASRAAAAGVVERQTQHMARLIEDLLDATRVRMGKVTLKRELLDLSELVAEVVESWRLAGRLSGRAAVAVQLSPAWINGDRARIDQIVSNLLDNALKFTPATGSVDLNLSRQGDEAVLRVTDDGCGIAPETRARIFEPFVQDEYAVNSGERGLGLGLGVVQRLTQLHGGMVSAESEGAGRGARFTVRLPAVDAPHDSNLGLSMVAIHNEAAVRPGDPAP